MMSAADRIADYLAPTRPSSSATLDEVRAWVDMLGDATDYPEDVAPPEPVGGRCHRIAPRGVEGKDAILYLHGGGYVSGSVKSHGSMVARLASFAGMPAYLVDYRRAPEHTAPAAIDDVIAAYAALVADGFRVSVAGDSAGSGLALALCLALRRDGRAMPAGLLCISPWTDLRSEAAHHSSTVLEPLLDSDQLAQTGRDYAGNLPLDDERLSPALADLTGLPPILIQIGAQERLLGDARALAAQAISAGVETLYSEWPGMVHVWHLFGKLLPDADEALRAAARQIRYWHGRDAIP